MSPQARIHEFLDLLLSYGASLMEAGAHTSRVQRNVARIADSFGYEVAVTLFQRTVMISVTQKDDFSVNHTLLRKARNGTPINFETISLLSTLSWEALDEGLSLDEIRQRYHEIIGRKRISRWLVLGMVGVANASFCHLFGGDYLAMASVLVATLVAFFLRQELSKRHVNHMAMVVVCAFVASFIAGLGYYLPGAGTPSVAVASSVLFLIPGVPLINSVIDVLQGYVLIGISRAVNAFNLIICIAIGLSITLYLLGVNVL